MGKTGVINRDFTGEENNVYHDVIRLFKIYRAVNWRMQIKVNQVKHRIREEYGTDLDEFLDSIYQAGICYGVGRKRNMRQSKERCMR